MLIKGTLWLTLCVMMALGLSACGKKGDPIGIKDMPPSMSAPKQDIADDTRDPF